MRWSLTLILAIVFVIGFLLSQFTDRFFDKSMRWSSRSSLILAILYVIGLLLVRFTDLSLYWFILLGLVCAGIDILLDWKQEHRKKPFDKIQRGDLDRL